jgi:hypothetical protein
MKTSERTHHMDLNTAIVLLLDAQRSLLQGDKAGAVKLIRSAGSTLGALRLD